MGETGKTPGTEILPIGGFMTLEITGTGGVFTDWGADPRLAWGNATSALAALVAHLGPGRVWLPGFFCASALTAVPPHLRRYFPVTAALDPDLDALAELADGDLVLAVDYFGRAPGAGWRDFVASRPGVTFIEDRAQALSTGEPAWGDWQLFSPRKVLGVPEGGLLVPITDRARGQNLPGPARPPDPLRVIERFLPMLARAEAPQQNQLWHGLNQAAEANQIRSDHAMSRFALDLLRSSNLVPAIAARKANFAFLARGLADLAALDVGQPHFAPLGFPILLPSERRDDVLGRLHARAIFPAVHWRDIAAPPEFSSDHDRADRIVTLPVDPRYGAADMDRLVQDLREAMR